MSDSSDRALRGGCACGGIRFEMSSAPLIVHCCHCRWCQRETGSAFVLNALIESNRVKVLAGEPEPVATPSESGKGQTIWRCPACRVAVWSHYAAGGSKVKFVRVGTLDDPAALPPDVHIYTESKLPWVTVPEETPAFAEYYDPRTTWSSESQGRYRSYMESG